MLKCVSSYILLCNRSNWTREKSIWIGQWPYTISLDDLYWKLENTRADWLRIVFLKLDGDTELARAVDVMMVRAKRINILIIKVNKLFSFFPSQCFLKYRDIATLVKVWENSKKLWKHSPAASVPTAFLVLINFHSSFYLTIRLRARVFHEQIVNEAQLTMARRKRGRVV